MIPNKIVVICGGTSSEREVSLSSGKAITESLQQKDWDAVMFDLTEREIIYRIEELSDYDLVFIAYHGGAGEDGRVQAVLDVARIPYTGSGPTASAMAMDKIISKRLFQQAGIPTPEWFAWELPEKPSAVEIAAQSGLEPPIVVKPACQGSTVGITIAENMEQLADAISKAFKFGHRILFEKYIPGRELTTAILQGETLPVVEIRPKTGFYDYEHKYTKGTSDYFAPADIPGDLSEQMITAGTDAFNLLGMRHYGRVDFRYDGEHFYCLEVNSLPGMTGLSLVPMAAKVVGIDFPDLTNRIAEMALNR